jgi:hypothetical protein
MFALEFLVPETSVDEYLRFNASVEILGIRSHFKVSAMALCAAAYSASRMSECTYRQTCMTLSQNGFRSSEPGGMPNYEMSRIIPQVFSSPSVSAAKIADDLALPVGDVHALTFGVELRSAQGTEVTSDSDVSRSIERHPGRGHLRAI